MEMSAGVSLLRTAQSLLTGRTITQLIDVCEKWTETFVNKNNIDIVYLDMQNAFDSVPLENNIATLKSYGI